MAAAAKVAKRRTPDRHVFDPCATTSRSPRMVALTRSVGNTPLFRFASVVKSVIRAFKRRRYRPAARSIAAMAGSAVIQKHLGASAGGRRLERSLPDFGVLECRHRSQPGAHSSNHQ